MSWYSKKVTDVTYIKPHSEEAGRVERTILIPSPSPMKFSDNTSFKIYFCLALFLCISLAIVASQAYAQGPDSLRKYLPENASITPWKADGQPKVFKGKELYNYIDGGAEIFFEYGFTQAIAQRHTSGDTSITVDIYEMNHPKAAFGIYSVQRDSDMPALEVGDDGTTADTVVSFIQERFYVVVTANRSAKDTKKASVRIARAVSQKINKSSQLPDLIGMLPPSNLVPRSQGYVSGLLGLNTQLYLGDSNILGINGRTVECAFARYKVKENQAHLLIVRYPDSAAANAALHAVREAFTKKFKTVTVNNSSAFSDRRNRFYRLAADNNFIYIISRADSADLIKEIGSSINPSTTKRK